MICPFPTTLYSSTLLFFLTHLIQIRQLLLTIPKELLIIQKNPKDLFFKISRFIKKAKIQATIYYKPIRCAQIIFHFITPLYLNVLLKNSAIKLIIKTLLLRYTFACLVLFIVKVVLTTLAAFFVNTKKNLIMINVNVFLDFFLETINVKVNIFFF